MHVCDNIPDWILLHVSRIRWGSVSWTLQLSQEFMGILSMLRAHDTRYVWCAEGWNSCDTVVVCVIMITFALYVVNQCIVHSLDCNDNILFPHGFTFQVTVDEVTLLTI